MKKIFVILGMIMAVLSVKAKEQPEFPGGEAALKKYIEENTRYPEVAKENGIEGIVEVGFMVLIDGELKNVKVLRPIDPDLEKEAVRVVIAMPAWIPAEKDGTPVEAPSQVSVPFILE